MKKLFNLISSLQKKYAADLKPYREKLDSDAVENLADKALKDHCGKDIDLSYNNQHYGWFIWDPIKEYHVQYDMNDFKPSDNVKDVREFVSSLKKVKIEDYED